MKNATLTITKLIHYQQNVVHKTIILSSSPLTYV